MLLEELASTKVAIIDDTEQEILSIEQELDEKEIGYKFIKVDLAGEGIVSNLLTNIELLFLDLNYTKNFGAAFDPYLCAELVKSVVPIGRKYHLVTWTRDPDSTDEVVEVLKEANLSPVGVLSKEKEKYRIGDNVYDAKRLFDELNSEFQRIEDIQEFPCRVIAIEEKSVLLNCLIQDEPPVFEIRRFDRALFQTYIELVKGSFLQLKITTKPGTRIFEFSDLKEDLSKMFSKPDDFDDLDDLAFLIE